MIDKKLFVAQKPASTFLQKYIAYYYFQECIDATQKRQYIFYPHYKNALSIYKNAAISYSNNLYEVVPSKNENYHYAYQSVNKVFKQVAQQPPFYKIGIVFQSLGINHFLSAPLVRFMATKEGESFEYFRVSMNPFLDKIYAAENIADKIHFLDEYFEAQYVGFQESRLECAITLLLNASDKYTVNTLAQDLAISRKTLLRLFNKHLCCSVKDYINVVQFRKALQRYQTAHQKPLLTNLAYDVGYYDQSEFINHFKKITGFNPSKLLGNIQQLGSEDTFWTLS
ncbi:AraC family transcriptional regulator [Aureispira sp. CCB-QB1]|uniref:helix-turn-helix domain-containing protein n=1 Tax=Aureispira sp. CCB-QB1 TaxID=1313421 RepID=UPI0006970942|nr:AraC family transcriptional regulator [Aureispira sp. CCB-QB1]